MKISRMNNSPICFKAGKTTIYADFDSTYMPGIFNHRTVVKNEGFFDKNFFVSYFEKFSDLFHNLKDKCTFIISSGRNLYETQYFIENLPPDVSVPYPTFFISSNGSDILKKTGSGFNYSKCPISEIKENEIKELSGWDSKKVKNIINNILSENNIELVESKVNSNKNEYGKYSFESMLESAGITSGKNVASLRQNEALHVNLAFMPEFDDNYFKKIANDIRQKLSKIGVSFSLDDNPKNKYAGNYRTIDICPNVQQAEKLSKLFDPLKKLQEAIKKNDLVIVAGDSSNDEPMLNLYNYFRQKNLSKKDIDKLPIISILVENGRHKMDDLRRSLSEFNHDEVIKFIYVNSDDKNALKSLPDAIELAIQSYAKQNEKFANALSSAIDSEFSRKLGINVEQIKKTKNKFILPIIASSLALGSLLAFAFVKKRKQTKNELQEKYFLPTVKDMPNISQNHISIVSETFKQFMN